MSRGSIGTVRQGIIIPTRKGIEVDKIEWGAARVANARQQGGVFKGFAIKNFTQSLYDKALKDAKSKQIEAEIAKIVKAIGK